ncbi:molybdopterin-dependent oxidoreductase [Verticiella sediminum]|uniref:Molybdopterin-dependent oxidoreductase n=1 Tax=Verticiella sediminum TaxID=1247510 RepID=A0A556AYQ8_9BURK|nr:molybdopterin cofactor-binding domain-containing protein [Verticiella sediminum]TSH98072.1 molybdopterin-dependent oxidoreductase [Verticiella sediminum]
MRFEPPHHILRPLEHLRAGRRPDVDAKLAGNPGYLTDRIRPGQLRGVILGSPHPHARIVSIDTRAALALDGVHAVVTHRDIPGTRDYGLRRADRPFLCGDKVRYIGDPVAAVAAHDLPTALAAARLIDVAYAPLPTIADPERALDPDLEHDAWVHAGGNLLHAASHARGDLAAAQAMSAHVIEEVYHTPRQMHAFLETEGGVAEPDGAGGLHLFFGGHNPARERQVIADMLGLPLERVQSTGTPVGGSYGGKDELTVQPIAALLAWKTGRAVRLHLGRPQSTDFGVKRHPMRVRMRTGCDARGRLTFHEVEILADTGAYATHGPEVLDAALEHAPGPYRYQAVAIQARLVYTNNGVAGAFRGFGAVQTQFALERQIDRLAACAGMAPDAFRALNLTPPHAPGPLGQQMVPFDGPHRALDVARAHPLWQGPRLWRSAERRFIHAVGLALVHRSDGFGKGGPSASRMELALAADGAIELRCGFTELGQNLVGAIRAMCARHLGCAEDDVRPVLGDTRVAPDSGPVAASRATTLVWRALLALRAEWMRRLLAGAQGLPDTCGATLTAGPGGIHADGALCLGYGELARRLGGERPRLSVELDAEDPAGNAHDTHFVFGACAALAQVAVDTWSGNVRLERFVVCTSLGPTVSAQGLLGQMEGGAVMGMGMCVLEDLPCTEGRYAHRNLDGYLIPTLADAPRIEVLALQNLFEGDPIGPRGAGEIGVNIAVPAVANALSRALGLPVNRLPLKAPDIVAMLESGAAHARATGEPPNER